MRDATIEAGTADDAIYREGIAATAAEESARRAELGAELTARLERAASPSDEAVPAWLARDLTVAWLRLGRWADTVGAPGEVLASFDTSSLAGVEWPRTDPARHRRVFEAMCSRLGIASPDVATALAKHHGVEARLLRRRRLLDALRASLPREGGRLTREAVGALLDTFLPGVPTPELVEAAVTRTTVVLLAPASRGAALARWFPAQRRGYDARDGDPGRIAALARDAGFDTEEVVALLGDCVRAVLAVDLDAALLRETYGRLGAGDLIRAVHWRDPRRGCFLPPTITAPVTRGGGSERLLDAFHVDRDGVVRADGAVLDDLLDRWARARVEGEVPSILAEAHGRARRRRGTARSSACATTARNRRMSSRARGSSSRRCSTTSARSSRPRHLAGPRPPRDGGAWALPLRERAARGPRRARRARCAPPWEKPLRDAASRLAGDWLSVRGAVGGDEVQRPRRALARARAGAVPPRRDRRERAAGEARRTRTRGATSR
ncbi:MAG: hypothetical protein U0325_35575 [Polyangiales bacterium]